MAPHAARGQAPDVHDIGGGEVVAGEPGARLREARLHRRQALVDRLLGPGIEGVVRGGLHQLRSHAPRRGRLHAPVGPVEPEQVVGIVLVARLERQAPTAVHVDKVLCDGSSFGHRELSTGDGVRVGQRGRRLHGREGGELRWRQERRSRVRFKRILDTQLFAKPSDPFGLGDVEVVYGGRHGEEMREPRQTPGNCGE